MIRGEMPLVANIQMAFTHKNSEAIRILPHGKSAKHLAVLLNLTGQMTKAANHDPRGETSLRRKKVDPKAKLV
jgi:hypothetical protein